MTDDTRDADATEPAPVEPSPVEPFGLDTPGPEATPEQDASVTALLGMLRPDDIAMPDDVVRRLDAVIAEERRAVTARTTTGLAGVATLDDPDHGSDRPGAADGDGLATVLPLGSAQSRRGRDLGWLTWLGGAAAAVIVVGGGFAVLGHGGGSSSVTTAASAAPEAAAGSVDAAAGTTAIRATNTSYSAKTLPTQVGALLSTVQKDTAATAGPLVSSPALGAASGASSQAASSTDVPTPAVVPTAAGSTRSSSGFSVDQPALTSDTVAACMTHLELPGVVPLVVDHGTFEGKPADVVVVPTEGDATTVDVYVLQPGCATAVPLVFELATIPRA